MVRLALVGAAAALALISTPAWAEVAGVWATPEGKAHVRIAPCDAGLCGRVVWLEKPNDKTGAPKRDRHNEDESLRDRPIIGLQLIGGFRQVSPTEWDDGEIYNPEDGKTYSSELELVEPDRLKVSGCVLFFCKSQVWHRVE